MTIRNLFCTCHNIEENDKFSICVRGENATFDFYDFESYWEIPTKFKDASVSAFTINDEPGKHLFIV